MGNKTPPNLWEKGKSGNPKGYTREMRKLKLEQQVQLNAYVEAAREVVPVKEFQEMVKKVAQQVKTRGDVKAFDAICKILMQDLPTTHAPGGRNVPTMIEAVLEKVYQTEPDEIVDIEVKEITSGN